MSDVRSALPGAQFSGAVDVAEAGPQGMVSLRGDLDAPRLREAVKAATGLDVPEARRAVFSEAGAVCWMSPDELLILTDYGRGPGMVDALSASLAGAHHLAADVSDARALFRIGGEGAQIRDTLAKVTPADLRLASLPVGEVRRTRLQQVPAAFWFVDPGLAEVVAFRSVATYVFDLLRVSADADAEVGHF